MPDPVDQIHDDHDYYACPSCDRLLQQPSGEPEPSCPPFARCGGEAMVRVDRDDFERGLSWGHASVM